VTLTMAKPASRDHAFSGPRRVVMRDEDGDVHAVTSWAKDQLKQMPEHVDGPRKARAGREIRPAGLFCFGTEVA
jgi:hypothetical protein